MKALLLVAFGGAVGASLRHLVNLGALRLVGVGLPWGTLFINVVGSCAMGLLVGGLLRLDDAGLARDLRLLLATGVLGGFTTFSAFSLETVTLYDDRGLAAALTYVTASVVLAVAGLCAGLVFWRALG
jgi:fluoride exporter